MKSKIIKTFSLLVLFATMMHADDFVTNVSKRGTTAAPFLSIGQGARALSMGGAFVAVADDPSAMYWNPAGIADLTGNRVVFDHTQWIADINYNYFGATINLGSIGTLGLNFTSSSIPEMKVTTVDVPEGTGETFGVTDGVFGVTWAMKLTDKFSIGFNPKYVYQRIARYSASAIALDMGVKYLTPFKGITLGMAITNFGTKMQMGGASAPVLYDPDPLTSGNNGRIPADIRTEQWTLPLNFKVGLAYDVFSNDGNRLLLAVDASHPSDDYESVNVGCEYVIYDFVFLRGGYRSLFLSDSQERYTLGFGIKQALLGNVQFTVDYAYEDMNLLKNVQKFSLGVIF